MAIDAYNREAIAMLLDLMEFANSPEDYVCTWRNGELSIEPVKRASAQAVQKSPQNKQPR